MEKVNKVWIVLIFAVFVYLAMGIYADIKNLISSMEKISSNLLLQLLALTTFGYFLRLQKWSYMVKKSGLKLEFKENAFVFFSGLAMTVTPAKIGEVWRSFLIKEIRGIKLSKTIPIVIFDRLTDIASLMLLSLLGLIYFQEIIVLLLLLLFFLVFFFVLFFKSRRFLSLAESVMKKRFGKYAESVSELWENSSKILTVRNFAVATLLGVSAWFLECLGLYLIANEFGQLDLGICTFIFSFASLAGAVSMIPGGLGVAEVTISALLQFFGLDVVEAVTVSVIIRLATLWYGAIFGIAIYFGFKRFLILRQ